MTAELETLKSRSEQHELAVVAMNKKVEGLPEATKVDLKPRVERVSTMSLALKRDVSEAAGEGGADLTTARELNQTLEKEITSLRREVETLAQGNPTTFDVVGDKLMNGIAGAAGKVKAGLSNSEDK